MAKTPSELIDARIDELGDWPGETPFAKGASLDDPSELEHGFTALVRGAIELNIR